MTKMIPFWLILVWCLTSQVDALMREARNLSTVAPHSISISVPTTAIVSTNTTTSSLIVGATTNTTINANTNINRTPRTHRTPSAPRASERQRYPHLRYPPQPQFPSRLPTQAQAQTSNSSNNSSSPQGSVYSSSEYESYSARFEGEEEELGREHAAYLPAPQLPARLSTTQAPGVSVAVQSGTGLLSAAAKASAGSLDRASSANGSSLFVGAPDSAANNGQQSVFARLFSHIDKQWKFAEVILIIVISAILNLVTIIGNIMVLISFKMDRSLQTVSNYFLLSLALADLLIGLISMPLYTLYLLLNYWPLGPLMCDIWLAIDYLNSNAAVLNMLIISFDRYFSVTRPLTYRAKRTTKHACLMISGAWIFSLTIWTPAIFTYPYYYGGRTVQGTDKCEIEFVKANTYLTFVTAILAFYIPVIIMIYLYWRIWLETKKRYRDLTTLFLVSGVGAAAPARATRPIQQQQQQQQLPQVNPANSAVSAANAAAAAATAAARKLQPGSQALMGKCSHLMTQKALAAPVLRHAITSSPKQQQQAQSKSSSLMPANHSNVGACIEQLNSSCSRLSVAPSPSNSDTSNTNQRQTTSNNDQQVQLPLPAAAATGNNNNNYCYGPEAKHDNETTPQSSAAQPLMVPNATTTTKCRCPWCPRSVIKGGQKVKKSPKSAGGQLAYGASSGGLCGSAAGLSRCPKSCIGFAVSPYKADCSKCQMMSSDPERLSCQVCQAMYPCLVPTKWQYSTRGCHVRACKFNNSNNSKSSAVSGAALTQNHPQQQPQTTQKEGSISPATYQQQHPQAAIAGKSESKKRSSSRHHHASHSGHHHHHHQPHHQHHHVSGEHRHSAKHCNTGACNAGGAYKQSYTSHHSRSHHHHNQQQQRNQEHHQQQHRQHAACIPSCPFQSAGRQDNERNANGYIDKQSKLSMLTSGCQQLISGNTKSLGCASIIRKVHPTNQGNVSPVDGDADDNNLESVNIGASGDGGSSKAGANTYSETSETIARNDHHQSAQVFMGMSQDRNAANITAKTTTGKCTSVSAGSDGLESLGCSGAPMTPASSSVAIGTNEQQTVASEATSKTTTIMVDSATSPIQFPAKTPIELAHSGADYEESDNDDDSERDCETRIVCSSGDKLRFESGDLSLSPVPVVSSEKRSSDERKAPAVVPSKRSSVAAQVSNINNSSNCKRCHWRPCNKGAGLNNNHRCGSEAVVAHDVDCRICNPIRQCSSIAAAKQSCRECSRQCSVAAVAARGGKPEVGPQHKAVIGRPTTSGVDDNSCDRRLSEMQASARSFAPAETSSERNSSANEVEEAKREEANSRLPILSALRNCHEQQPEERNAGVGLGDRQSNGSLFREGDYDDGCVLASALPISNQQAGNNNGSKDQKRKRAKKFSQKLTFSDILVERGSTSRADSYAMTIEQGNGKSNGNSKGGANKGNNGRFNIRFSRGSISESTNGDEFDGPGPQRSGEYTANNSTNSNNQQTANMSNLSRIKRLFCPTERNNSQLVSSHQEEQQLQFGTASSGSDVCGSISGQVSGPGEQQNRVGFLRYICCAAVGSGPRTKRFSSNDSSSHKNSSSSDDSEAGISSRRHHNRNPSTSSNNTQAGGSSNKPPSCSSHHPIQPKSERKAAKTLSTLLLVFIVTWLPYNILVLIKTLSGGEDQVPEKIWNFSYYLCYINSTINPLCYALCNAQFRRTYMRILKCKLSNEHNSTRRLVPLQSSNTWNKADLRLTSDASSNLATMTSANTNSTNNNNNNNNGYNSRR